MTHEYEIVMVEDNPNDAELMIRSLNKPQVVNRLIVLEDGEQALNYFFCRGKYSGCESARSPKVVFLDFKLPKVDGLEVLRQLKSNEQTKKIPIVIVSSSSQDTDIEAAYNLGANSYVVKPVEFAQFRERINQLGFYWLVINEYR